MRTINVTQEELESLQVLTPVGFNNGGALYHKSDEILYKIFYSTELIEEKEKNIDFLLDKIIDHAVLPIEKIILDGQFFGYTQRYMLNSKTFREETSLTYLDRLKIVRDIYVALRKIHELGIYLGDVHRDNFIYRDTVEGAIVDFEAIGFKGEEFKFGSYYKVKKSETSRTIISENQNTDNIKTIAAALSFIYGVNLEQFIVINSVETLIKVLRKLNIPCMSKLQTCLTNYSGDIKYFDEILEAFSMQDFNFNASKAKEIKNRYIY